MSSLLSVCSDLISDDEDDGDYVDDEGKAAEDYAEGDSEETMTMAALRENVAITSTKASTKAPKQKACQPHLHLHQKGFKNIVMEKDSQSTASGATTAVTTALAGKEAIMVSLVGGWLRKGQGTAK